MNKISLEKLRSYSQIKLAYLIGSVARDEQRKDSDIDIALIADNIKNLNYGKLYNEIADILNKDNLDMRVVIPKETDPLFLFQIVHDGKLLYKISDDIRLQFEFYALKMYYDTQYFRDIYNGYLDKRFEQKKFAR